MKVAQSPTDGRSVAIPLSPAGERLAREVDARIAAMITIDRRFPRAIGQRS